MYDLTKQNTVIVVFGASGDLAKKKTYPALHGLYKNGFLPEDTQIIGYARTKLEIDEFREKIKPNLKSIPADKDITEKFLKNLHYFPGKYDEDEPFKKLNEYINKLEEKSKHEKKNRLFYMALPPSVFTTVATHIKNQLYTKKGFSRLIVEKPFGKDIESSRKLVGDLAKLFTEEEIFRIDHYLGKEMVKNIMTLRFANIFLGAIWCKEYIDNVQITFKEPFGAEGRGGYFDEYGIIRDVMQNHLLQVFSVLTMEKPKSLDSERIRDAKVELLKCVNPIKKEDLLIGQYTNSTDGEKKGYREDETVPDDSTTPTYAAVTLFIKNSRWEGVPFILKCGKALDQLKTEVRIQFRDVANPIFENLSRNELVIRVQPGEAVYMKMINKKPGLSMDTMISELDLTYHRRFSDTKIPEAYEALILDALAGDHSNFVRDDELDVAWKIFTPILHYIENEKLEPIMYPYGSRGPKEVNSFVEKYGFKRDVQEYNWEDPSNKSKTSDK
ncbi:glucose-6-P dehydrogenase [Basidiobolus meristosporus CBS 931.73]|uniref:Glucose-6-phosphate 1-dehydrogenase n=1 Tax=Basidiobolus meristosporus CBS 931.73 TaxID=1314790 RepID=A0A1Y1Z5C8_9FUNG|nr:glucose-6-P dehydrogenase [Basidiobolus meristosporus CBS 931.73]|eukprot:ORY05005.1 glucose-6-P dehydrogenase [Basidiobolus meristosporus CBS 931.73]